MNDIAMEIRTWGSRVLLALLLIYSVYQVLARLGIALIRTFPGTSFLAWLASPEWVVLFAVVNAFVFPRSLHPINAAAGTPFLSTLLEDSLIGAQMGALLLAAGLLIGGTAVTPRVVAAPGPANASDWLLATGFGLLANLLALVDSVAQRVHGSVGPTHFIVWLVQNLGCIFFFGTIFVQTLRGTSGFAFLGSPRAALLWLPVLVLLGATYFDFKWPINK
jgi:hypothetical protein